MATTNRQIQLASLPTGKLGPEHFQLAEAPMPVPADGEVLLKVLLISLDAANRAWMQGATYRAALAAGQVMAGGSISEVVASNAPASPRATWCLPTRAGRPTPRCRPSC
jgi:NADPH-dependent curcumin reductase CurA